MYKLYDNETAQLKTVKCLLKFELSIFIIEQKLQAFNYKIIYIENSIFLRKFFC